MMGLADDVHEFNRLAALKAEDQLARSEDVAALVSTGFAVADRLADLAELLGAQITSRGDGDNPAARAVEDEVYASHGGSR